MYYTRTSSWEIPVSVLYCAAHVDVVIDSYIRLRLYDPIRFYCNFKNWLILLKIRCTINNIIIKPISIMHFNLKLAGTFSVRVEKTFNILYVYSIHHVHVQYCIHSTIASSYSHASIEYQRRLQCSIDACHVLVGTRNKTRNQDSPHHRVDSHADSTLTHSTRLTRLDERMFLPILFSIGYISTGGRASRGINSLDPSINGIKNKTGINDRIM